MRTQMKSAAAALTAALMLTAALAGTGGAGRLRKSEAGFLLLYEPATIEAGGNSISCELTLAGNFVERTIPKNANSQIGVITHVERRTAGEPPCIGGTITVLTETLPWKYNYVGFTGALPDIAQVRQAYIGVSMQIRTSSGITCLAGTTARNPLFAELLVNRTTRRDEGLRLDETRGIPLGGGFVCSLAGEARISGLAHILNLPGTGFNSTELI